MITSLASKSVGSPDNAYQWLFQSGGVSLATGITVGLGDGTETKLFLDTNGVGFKNAGGFTTNFRCTNATAAHNLEFHFTNGAGKVYPDIIALLAADNANSTVTPAAVSGFSVTLAASGLYEFEMILLMETATTTVSPRFSIEGPTAQTTWVSYEILTPLAAGTAITNPGTAGSQVMNAWGTDFVNVTNMPAAATTSLFKVKGMVLISGTAPAVPVSVEIWSETAATAITLKANSMMRFRKLN